MDVARVRHLDRWVYATCALCTIAIFVGFRDLRHDDAYITFQYARSIAEGDGFVFNAGQRVLGTTTPLFTLLMAAIYAVAGDVLAPAAIAISALAVGAQGALIWLLARDRAPLTAATLAALMMLGFGSLGVLALETSLYSMLVLATITALDRARPNIAGFCLGLAFLTRYDAGLLVVVVVGWQLVVHRTLPVRMLVVSLAVVAPWLTFAQLYFGSVFPHTLGAKTSLTPMARYLDESLTRMLSPVFGLRAAWWMPTLLVACAMLGVRWAWRSARSFLPLITYSAMHLLTYSWIGPATNHTWHLHLPMLVFRILVVAGVIGSLEELRARRRRIATCVLALLATGMVVTTMRSLSRYAASVETAYWLGGRHHRYEEVAGWLALHVVADRSLFATEVGTLAYLTRRHLYDPFGLINDTNDWPRSRMPSAKAALVARFSADVVLFDSPREAAMIGAPLGYQIVHVFPWGEPWSTIAVRSQDTLTPLGRIVSERTSPARRDRQDQRPSSSRTR